MSPPPAPPPLPPTVRRDWTFPVIAAVIVGVLAVLAVCAVGGTAAYLSLRRGTPATPAPAPSAAQAPPEAAKPGPECLIGNWLLTNATETTQLYGTSVQLSSKGTIASFAPDGTYTWRAENIVLSGTSGGNSYEVIFNGTLKLNYVADAEKILYSNPNAAGTTTWKVNGKVRDSEPLSASLEADTYRCLGNELRMFWSRGASEYKRIVPPGVPV